MRKAAAANPATAASTLLDLASDKSAEVRDAVHNHPALPATARQRLDAAALAATIETRLRQQIESGDDEQRYAAADDTRMTDELRRSLARHDDRLVRGAIAGSTETPPELLKTLADDSEWNVRIAVAGNPECPHDLLEAWASDPDSEFRFAVVENMGCPRPVLEQLVNDPDALIASEAAAALKRID